MIRTAAMILLAAVWNPFLQPESREARKGLEAYREGDYIEALTHFREAGALAQEPAVYDYNAGLAAQGAGNPEAAVNYFLKARGASALPPGAADYNRGYSLADLGQAEEALAAFRQTLREYPGDEDARYNYEVLLRRMQADSSQGGGEDQEQSDSQSQEQDSQDQQQNNSDSQQGEGGTEEQQQTQPQQGQPTQSGEEEGDQPQAQPSQAVPLDQQQAERLLNALMQGERDLLKSRLKSDRRKRAEKDW